MSQMIVICWRWVLAARQSFGSLVSRYLLYFRNMYYFVYKTIAIGFCYREYSYTECELVEV